MVMEDLNQCLCTLDNSTHANAQLNGGRLYVASLSIRICCSYYSTLKSILIQEMKHDEMMRIML